MKINFHILFIATFLLPLFAGAQNIDDDYDEAVFMDMDFEHNLLTPEAPSQTHKKIKDEMGKQAREIAAHKYKVDLTRQGEVIIITLPIEDLFNPNDTLLKSTAPALLSPIVKLWEDPDLYKIVYAVHSDNTGSPEYNMSLSHKRNNSIYDWLIEQVDENLIVIPFEFGDTRPIAPNDSRSGRATNRRLEIYMVPGPKIIKKAMK